MGKAATKAQMKYQSKTYDRITVYVPKGEKERIKTHVLLMQHASVNSFITQAIEEKIARDLLNDNPE